MKKMLKGRFPRLFLLIKEIYNDSSWYKRKLVRIKEKQQRVQEKIFKEEAVIMNTVFQNNYVVQNGHFKGMNYIKRSSCSMLLPKILGSYEEPIQEWVREVIENKNYENILDIGCAEGYYACGFAMRLPNTKITAYDIDERARNDALMLQKANELKNIEIKAECTHEELNLKCKEKTLVFCDIEGYEEILLNPKDVPNLKYVDLLIESHDCFVSNITEELVGRFYGTHKIKIIIDYPYRVDNYSTPRDVTKEQFKYIIDERRPLRMKFIYMETIYGKV